MFIETWQLITFLLVFVGFVFHVERDMRYLDKEKQRLEKRINDLEA